VKFGEIPVGEAAGAILAHSVAHAGGVFKKGRVLSAADIVTLRDSGVAHVFAARLAVSDVAEDEAAAAVSRVIGAGAVAVQAPFTGRANLHATAAGVAVVDAARVTALNALHESLTLATVPPYAAVAARQMVATVKVIPFAVPRAILDAALALLGTAPLLRVAPWRPRAVGLVITGFGRLKPALIEKTEEAMKDRVAALGSWIAEVDRIPHEIERVAQALGDQQQAGCSPILVFGASAIVDRGDVVPAAVARAGGEVLHLGMPVDPGNLLMLGRLGETPVIGVPTCARSPKLNGFDWILQLLLADVPVTPADIMAMGAGGLLSEIPTRPAPREAAAKPPMAPGVAALVLAAGKSSRMGANKLLEDIAGKPMIRHTVEAAAAAAVAPIVVVTGRDRAEVMAALAGLPVTEVHNPHYADGLSTSLHAGLAALGDADAALVCLGDMPRVSAAVIDRLIAAFNPVEHRAICVPAFNGKRGNPVLWSARYFEAMKQLTGDKGARELLTDFGEDVVEVAMSDDAVLDDIDTPEALARLRSVPPA
jgi:molybdenum cofactor cytidylyltransferase